MCPEDPEASISTRGLTLLAETLAYYALSADSDSAGIQRPSRDLYGRHHGRFVTLLVFDPSAALGQERIDVCPAGLKELPEAGASVP